MCSKMSNTSQNFQDKFAYHPRGVECTALRTSRFPVADVPPTHVDRHAVLGGGGCAVSVMHALGELGPLLHLGTLFSSRRNDPTGDGDNFAVCLSFCSCIFSLFVPAKIANFRKVLQHASSKQHASKQHASKFCLPHSFNLFFSLHRYIR